LYASYDSAGLSITHALWLLAVVAAASQASAASQARRGFGNTALARRHLALRSGRSTPRTAPAWSYTRPRP
jgi:hypothetical protein